MLVQVPEVEGNEVLRGQVLAVEVAGLTDSLGTFKARLAEVRIRLHCCVCRRAEPTRRCVFCVGSLMAGAGAAASVIATDLCVTIPIVCASWRAAFLFVAGAEATRQ